MESLNPENVSMLELDDSGCVQDGSVIENSYKGFAHMLDLSDDVLLCILQYLNPRDLKALGHTCARLGTLICDRTLWTKVDARTSPVGQQRLKWFLTHCLSPATTELKIAGYANKFSRCLGIQDLHWPVEADQDFIRGTCIGSQDGVDVEHFLLRMWYPHLPRRDIILANLAEQSYRRYQSGGFAVSPRWPDKAEADSKKAKAEAEAAASKSGEASTSTTSTVKLGPNLFKMVHHGPENAGPSCSGQKSSSSAENSGSSDQKPGSSDKKPGSSDQKPGSSDQKPGSSDQKPGCSDQKPGSSDQKPGSSDQKPGKSDPNSDQMPGSSTNKPEISGLKRKSDEKPSDSDPKSRKSDSKCSNAQKLANFVEKSSGSSQKQGDSAETSGVSSQNQQNTDSKMDEDGEYPYLFDDDFRDDCKGPQFTLTTNLMRLLRKTCSNLTSLALEYCNLDYKTTNLRHFPLHLKKLSLRGSRCYNLPLNTSYLGKVQERLPELEYLDVSECDWFEPASLMPLSKLPNLIEVYMRDCKRLTECVAYASLATRYGFRKLKVFDVRGSPLADSEVSALGWLPCLEELYVAPPEEFSTVTEHTHSWSDTQTEFIELDSWEIEEPDYYKIKSPEPEEEEDEKDDEPDNERSGDNPLNNPWWSHERRIIVIQPNANRQQLEERYPFMRQQNGDEERPAQPRAPRPGERGPEGILPERIPGLPDGDGPAGFPRQIGVAYRGIGPIRCGNIDIMPTIGNPRPSQRQHVLVEPQPGPATPRSGPAVPKPVPADPREGLPGPKNRSNQQKGQKPQQGTSKPQAGPSCQAGPSGSANPQQGPSNPQQGPSNPQQGPSNPQGGSGEGTKRRINLREAIDLAKRRRLEMDAEEEEMGRVPVLFPPYNPEICPRIRLEDVVEPQNDQGARPGCVTFRRHDLRPIMHIDVDIHRQSTIHIGSHVGYHLVSDSAILRFGRAINENVNYVHIGRHGIHTGSDSGSRPDRSNLRILSVTGYRNITDRSLQHLVTAAPYLLHIDFTETNVTPKGVEMFKAVRPDCDVIFSEFSRGT